MTPEQAREKADLISAKLRQWETRMWMRHAEAPVDLEYANNCRTCKGTGKAHFCATPTCSNPTNDFSECLHPTPEELEELAAIQEQYLALLVRTLSEIQKFKRKKV